MIVILNNTYHISLCLQVTQGYLIYTRDNPMNDLRPYLLVCFDICLWQVFEDKTNNADMNLTNIYGNVQACQHQRRCCEFPFVHFVYCWFTWMFGHELSLTLVWHENLKPRHIQFKWSFQWSRRDQVCPKTMVRDPNEHWHIFFLSVTILPLRGH